MGEFDKASVGDALPVQPTRRSLFGTLTALVSGVVTGAALTRSAAAAQPAGDADRLRALESQLQEVTQRLGTLEDQQVIRKLQHAYGYYMDKCLYSQVVDLFADDSEVVFGNGVYKGRAGVRRLYLENFQKNFSGGRDGPIPGFLLDHSQLQDIVDIAPDRRTAQARFRCFMQAGSHETRQGAPARLPQQWWEGGVYENTYVRDNGIWKIRRLNYHVTYQGNYEQGWRYWKPAPSLMPKTFPENPVGPDEVLASPLGDWPNTPVVPFHYAHPVTGKPWTPA